jgi:UDP-3-O-[3-hydroxymyristoyl] glucosamine N-acyltransferase
MLYEDINAEYGNELISSRANIHASVKIGLNTIIEEDVVIGEGTVIEHNSTIHRGVVIGKNCHISSNCTVSHAIIGDNCTIYPGARIGQDGFGYAPSSKGIKKVMQLGRVILQDFVDVGTNTCIDRGAIEDTIIMAGTKLDNLIQIAHNVQIGRNCFFAAQVGIAGSVTIGDQAMVGGQVGIAGHLSLGNGVMIAAQSGIMNDCNDNSTLMGSPASNKSDFLKCTAWLRRSALKK